MGHCTQGQNLTLWQIYAVGQPCPTHFPPPPAWHCRWSAADVHPTPAPETLSLARAESCSTKLATRNTKCHLHHLGIYTQSHNADTHIHITTIFITKYWPHIHITMIFIANVDPHIHITMILVTKCWPPYPHNNDLHHTMLIQDIQCRMIHNVA